MAINALPSTDFLHKILRYAPETGEFVWRERPREDFATKRACSVWNARYAGTTAGCGATGHGYRILVIRNRHFMAHRVAWKMMTGLEPVLIDHINHIRNDNRWVNLREVEDVSGNAQNGTLRENNRSGVTGVYWEKQTGMWRAAIMLRGVSRKLGRFTSFDAAIAARKAAEIEWGFHPNHGAAKLF